MYFSIVGKQLELSTAIKEYVSNAVDNLEKYNLDIISVRVVLSADEKNGKKGFNVEFSLNIAQKNTIVVSQKDKDLYAAIDLLIDRVKKVLRRQHDRNVSSKKIENKDLNSYVEEKMEGVDEIVPMELELYKPMEVEEAMNYLKDGNRQFFVFMDKSSKMRVIYKRKDGNFGLY